MTDQCRWNSRGPGDRKHQLDKVRRPLGALDLGAFEFSPFAAWQGEQFGEDAENELVSGAAADPDGDGLINLLEYAFVLDPQVASPGGLPRAARFEHAGDDYLAMEFRRPPAPTGLIYTTRVTESFEEWWPGSEYADFVAPTATTFSTDASDDTWTRVRLNEPTSHQPRRFIAVEVRRE